jgi:hypothetical protein
MATEKKMSKAAKVRAYQTKHPMASATEVAKATDTDVGYIYAIRHSDKNKAAKTPKQLKWRHVTVAPKDAALEGIARLEAANRLAEANQIYELTKGRDRVEMIEPPADNVNHPAHYKVGGIETIDFIEAKGLSYNLGNVVKYITRADYKGNREEDLAKARWYLNREIAKLFTK